MHVYIQSIESKSPLFTLKKAPEHAPKIARILAQLLSSAFVIAAHTERPPVLGLPTDKARADPSDVENRLRHIGDSRTIRFLRTAISEMGKRRAEKRDYTPSREASIAHPILVYIHNMRELL